MTAGVTLAKTGRQETGGWRQTVARMYIAVAGQETGGRRQTVARMPLRHSAVSRWHGGRVTGARPGRGGC